MLYLGIVIGLLVGAWAMHLKNTKDVESIKGALQIAQDKLKSVKSQLYKRRTSYKKKSNAQTNGKKTTRNKAANVKKTNI